MRIKKIGRKQQIIITIDEAKQIKRALDDYTFMCENQCGFAAGAQEEGLEKVTSNLDETILQFDAM